MRFFDILGRGYTSRSRRGLLGEFQRWVLRNLHRGHGGHGGMSPNEISGEVIGAAVAVHRVLGPGLLEKPYKRCLAHELRKRNR
jgi:hypothetical protein